MKYLLGDAIQQHIYLLYDEVHEMANVALGLDIFREKRWKEWQGCRIGLLSNQASLDSRLRPSREILSGLFHGQLKVLFSPQHGYFGEEQDNMIETNHSYDGASGIPLFSLYSTIREPSAEMLDLMDVLIIDLQDVGTRVYTFASTMLSCLKAAGREKKKVIILDRPNPLGGITAEGGLLKPDLFSFVGPYSLPMRHGLTIGELAGIFNHFHDLHADLDIIAMEGWDRKMTWEETGLRWMMPSPNMPTPLTAQVYPGQVIWEGTNLSEGRGTCRPFEIFGSPFLDQSAIMANLPSEAMEGCVLQRMSYRPTFHKWDGEICRGFMIHVTDPQTYQPFFTSLALLWVIRGLYPEEFQWKSPPYEYEYEKMPIDLILGDSSLRKEIENGAPPFSLRRQWEEELISYYQWRDPYLLYD